MNTTHTKESLIAFEEDIAATFMRGEIRAPIHLEHGNEEQLLYIFQNHVDEADWICGSWRQHFKCLLKGVPPEEVKAAILRNESISLCFPAYKVISSAIVGGILPIAVGIAMGIRLRQQQNKVVVFAGEMTAMTGVFHECRKYAISHDLPILFVIEDNGKSVCTNTRATWAMTQLDHEVICGGIELVLSHRFKTMYYKYESKWPHSGSYKRIQF